MLAALTDRRRSFFFKLNPAYEIAQVCHHNGIVGFVALVARKVGNLGKRPDGNCTQNWDYGAQHYAAQQIRTCGPEDTLHHAVVLVKNVRRSSPTLIRHSGRRGAPLAHWSILV